MPTRYALHYAELEEEEHIGQVCRQNSMSEDVDAVSMRLLSCYNSKADRKHFCTKSRRSGQNLTPSFLCSRTEGMDNSDPNFLQHIFTPEKIKAMIMSISARNGWTLPGVDQYMDIRNFNPDLVRHPVDPFGTKSSATYANVLQCLPKYIERGLLIHLPQKLFNKHLHVVDRTIDAEDCDLRNALIKLGFELQPSQLKDEGMEEILENLLEVSFSDLSGYDCIALVVDTYGYENYFFAADGLYDFSILYKFFKPPFCPSIAGKPCLMFVQLEQAVCRNQGEIPFGRFNHPGYAFPALRDKLTTIGGLESVQGSVVTRSRPNNFAEGRGGDSLGHSSRTAVGHSGGTDVIESSVSKIPSTSELCIFRVAYSGITKGSKKKTGGHFFSKFCTILNDPRNADCSLRTLIQLTYNLVSKTEIEAAAPIILSTLTNEIYFRPQLAEISTSAGSHDLPLVPAYDFFVNLSPGFVRIFSYETFKDYQHDREGSNTDRTILETVLAKAGFTVETYVNISKRETMDILDKASRMNYSRYNSIINIFMTHGVAADHDLELMAYDAKFYLTEIWPKFEEAPSLKGKPKIFLMQSCQGSAHDTGLTVQDVGRNLEPPVELDSDFEQQDGLFRRKYKKYDLDLAREMAGLSIPRSMGNDIFIATAAYPGYVSYRSRLTGAHFIQIFCKLFEQLRETTSFQAIMTQVCRQTCMRKGFQTLNNERVEVKQVPVIATTCIKEIFFRS